MNRFLFVNHTLIKLGGKVWGHFKAEVNQCHGGGFSMATHVFEPVGVDGVFL